MKRTVKALGWVVTGMLVLAIAGLAFIKFVPGYSFSVVKSGSMAPTINVGDVIITGPADSNVQPGTIVMFQYGKDTITHRVVAVNGEVLETKGDANQHADPWQTPVSAVKGQYLFRIPSIGYATTFVRTKLGWFLAVIVPAAVLVGWLCRDILKEAFRNETKTATAREEAKDAQE